MEVYTINGPGFGAMSCPPGWTPTPNGNCGGPPPKYYMAVAATLQKALKSLGAKIGDTALSSLVVDGIVGAQTIGALNRAFTQHLEKAPQSFKTGVLNMGDIAQNSQALLAALNTELIRQGGSDAAVPVPRVEIGPAQILPRRTYPKKLWALAGLSALVAGVGVFFALDK